MAARAGARRSGRSIWEKVHSELLADIPGEDVVINKRSKAVTKIIDNGKDYVISIWLKKPEGENGGQMNTASKWNQLGHGRWGR